MTWRGRGVEAVLRRAWRCGLQRLPGKSRSEHTYTDLCRFMKGPSAAQGSASRAGSQAPRLSGHVGLVDRCLGNNQSLAREISSDAWQCLVMIDGSGSAVIRQVAVTMLMRT